jgi:hypothetical protein
MSDIEITPSTTTAVSIGDKKYVVTKPRKLGDFLSQASIDGVTFLSIFQAGAKAQGVGTDFSQERLNTAGGIGWWWSWPPQEGHK